jgi:hypothetical protein
VLGTLAGLHRSAPMLTSRASQGPFEGGRRSTPGGQQLVPSGSLTRPHHPSEQTETRHLDLTGSDIRTRSDQSREPLVGPLSLGP